MPKTNGCCLPSKNSTHSIRQFRWLKFQWPIWSLCKSIHPFQAVRATIATWGLRKLSTWYTCTLFTWYLQLSWLETSNGRCRIRYRKRTARNPWHSSQNNCRTVQPSATSCFSLGSQPLKPLRSLKKLKRCRESCAANVRLRYLKLCQNHKRHFCKVPTGGNEKSCFTSRHQAKDHRVARSESPKQASVDHALMPPFNHHEASTSWHLAENWQGKSKNWQGKSTSFTGRFHGKCLGVLGGAVPDISGICTMHIYIHKYYIYVLYCIVLYILYHIYYYICYIYIILYYIISYHIISYYIIL